MDTINGITFYDSLNKLTTGYLIVWWIPFVILQNDEGLPAPLIVILAFCIGCVWQLIVEFMTDRNQRNNLDDIKNCYASLCNELKLCPNIDEPKSQLDYRNRYHIVFTEGYTGNIPVVEALERFTRSMIPLLTIYWFILLVIVICPHNDWLVIHNSVVAKASLLIIDTILIIGFCIAQKKYQSKVYKLVLEEYYFICENKKAIKD